MKKNENKPGKSRYRRANVKVCLEETGLKNVDLIRLAQY